MNNIILLAVCLISGIYLHKSGKFPDSTPKVLNGFVIYLSLPAVALLHVHRLEISPALLLTGAMSWIVFAAGFIFFRILEKKGFEDKNSIGALMLVCGLGNTSFVGLPMIEAYYGKENLGVGIIADQLGTFPVLTILGVLIATRYSSGETNIRDTLYKIIIFPPFQALVLALITKPFAYPEWLSSILSKLGETVTPLALVSVGFQLRFSEMKGVLKPLSAGLLYKLIIAPAVIMLIYMFVLGERGTAIEITVFEAAMAPMITAGIVAVDHNLNPKLVSLLLGIGIPLSFITLPAWWYLLKLI